MTRPISDLDVPTAQLQADMRTLVARQRLAAGIAAEARHLMENDAPFARLAADHPDLCSRAEDYPGWTPGGRP